MIVVSLDDSRWTELVNQCRDASPFHHPAWASLLAECYGYSARVFGVVDRQDRLLAALPSLEISHPLTRSRYVSLPFTDYVPLLSWPDHPEAVAGLVSGLADDVLAGRTRAVEVHADLPDAPGHANLYRSTRGFRHTLPLVPNPDDVWRTFSAMHRRNIRKAEHAGLDISLGRSAAHLNLFYKLHLQTRRRLGVPIQPRRFFRLLSRRMLDSNLGFVLSARWRGTPVAAAVFLHWNNVLVYKYGASDSRFWQLRSNNYLFWSAIQWACEHGFQVLDWGRTDFGDEGLRAFKRGWGTLEDPLTYVSVGTPWPPTMNSRARGALAAIIRRSPAWVCQLVGECLYRFVA